MAGRDAAAAGSVGGVGARDAGVAAAAVREARARGPASAHPTPTPSRHRKLAESEERVAEMRMRVTAVKATIAKNEQRVQELLRMSLHGGGMVGGAGAGMGGMGAGVVVGK